MDPALFALNPPEAMQIRTRRIAGTRYPILIVDGVYRRPEAVRALATSLAYVPLGESIPGGRGPWSP